MRQVTCVSPHGGLHAGDRRKGIAPAQAGYIDNAVLGLVAVGDTVAAPDPPEFIADGFHFVTEAGGADECPARGDGCWCGQHRALGDVPSDAGSMAIPPITLPAAPAPAPVPATPAAPAAGEGK